ncbi:MAG: recombination regulator RecX [Clostridiales Family XIII bacterium]|jgi:regulatory protein|nr:recombination regulator RecX [Clostridiales Family XIII bacterium]
MSFFEDDDKLDFDENTNNSKKKKKLPILEKAYYLLDYKDRTEKEMRDKLIESKYPEDEIEKTIAHLQEIGLLNDDAYAKRFIEYQIQKNRGLSRIVQELKRKGITEEKVRFVIEDEVDMDAYFDRAVSLCTKVFHMAGVKDLDGMDYKEKMKILGKVRRKLLTAGYEYDIINEAVNHAIREIGDSDS